MNLKSIKTNLFLLIKTISIILIVSAICLEIGSLQTLITNTHLPNILNPILIIAHLALAAHFIEGLIAAAYASSKNRMPIKYGIYTFFVGTVGLLELFENNDT